MHLSGFKVLRKVLSFCRFGFMAHASISILSHNYSLPYSFDHAWIAGGQKGKELALHLEQELNKLTLSEGIGR